MRATRFCVFLVVLLAVGFTGIGCTIKHVQYDVIKIPREIQNLPEGPLGNTVWVGELPRDLERSADAEVSRHLQGECGLQRVKRPPEAGQNYTPPHKYRLEVKSTPGTETREYFGQQVSVQFVKVSAQLILAESYKPIGVGIGKAFHGGGTVRREFGPFVIVHSSSVEALERALNDAFTDLCSRTEIRERSSGRTLTEQEISQVAPALPDPSQPPEGEKPAATYHGSALCLPPTCFGQRVTAEAVGTVAAGVRSGGVPLTQRGRTVKNGKIVSIK